MTIGQTSSEAVATELDSVTRVRVRTLEVVAPPTGAERFAIPHVPGLERVARRLEADDETELRRYLAEPSIASIRGSSGFGGQLERASAIGYGPVPCRRCGGTWRTVRRRNGVEVVTDWRDGTGFAPRDRFGKKVTYTSALAAYRDTERKRLSLVIGTRPCPPEGATWTAEQAWEALKDAHEAKGEYLVTEDELRDLFPTLPEHDPVTGQRLAHPCGACQGLGVVPRRAAKRHDVEVTVWPKGSSVQLGDADPDSRVSIWGAHEYLQVARILEDVASLSPLARAALELYYRPNVDRYRGTTGSRFRLDRPQATAWDALYELTPAENEPKATRGDESAWKGRRARQAAELYSHACAAWNFAAYGANSVLPQDLTPWDDLSPDDELDDAPSGVHPIDAATYLRLTADEAIT